MNETIASILTQLTIAHCSPTYVAVRLFSIRIRVFAGALFVVSSVCEVGSTNSFT